MPDGIVLQCLVLLVLIVCSGILTSAEAAYFSLGRARLRRLAHPTETTEPVVVDRPHDLMVTLLVGITITNIAAASLGAYIAHALFGSRWAILLSVGALVVILTAVGEALPMALAVRHPERMLRLVRRPVTWLRAALTPVRVALAGLSALTVRLVGRQTDGQTDLTEEDLRTLVDVGTREGIVEREEREMIHKVFKLEDTLVRSIMVPRTDMFCLDVQTPPERILPALREQLHSRVPVYEGSIDVIVGILYTKDLLPYVTGLPPGFDLRAHLHPPYFVPESKRADALLQELQAKRLHMAVVVDEYGGTAGLVALEDLLEELVGEIADEYDEPERLIQRLDAHTFRVAGKLSIEQLNAVTGLTLSNEAYETVGGWVLDLFGRVPRKSERKETAELVVTVEKVERTRVVEVLIALRKPAPSEAAA